MAEAKHLGRWGVAFAPPTIDLDALRARKEKVIATLTGGLKQLAGKRKVTSSARGRLRELADAQARTGRRPAAGRRSHSRSSIASSPPARSPTRIPAFDLPTHRVMDSTGALELPDVPESLLVVGGGYIGLEMGTVYAALGQQGFGGRNDRRPAARRRPRPGPAAAEAAGKASSRRIYLNTKVAALADKKDSIEVTFEGNVPEQESGGSAACCCALAGGPTAPAWGWKIPRSRSTPTASSSVDRQRRTADPHILAIGDVAGQPMLAHKASHEGKAAVEALAGQAGGFEPRAIPAVVFTDPEIAWAGLTETEAKRQGPRGRGRPIPLGRQRPRQAIGRTEGLTKWVIDPQRSALLGCGIVGAGAGDLISEAVLAIEMGCSVRDLAETIHPHPTLSETLGGAAEVYLRHGNGPLSAEAKRMNRKKDEG